MLIKILIYEVSEHAFIEELIDSNDIKRVKPCNINDWPLDTVLITCHSGQEYIAKDTIDSIYNKSHYLRNYEQCKTELDYSKPSKTYKGK